MRDGDLGSVGENGQARKLLALQQLEARATTGGDVAEPCFVEVEVINAAVEIEIIQAAEVMPPKPLISKSPKPVSKLASLKIQKIQRFNLMSVVEGQKKETSII